MDDSFSTRKSFAFRGGPDQIAKFAERADKKSTFLSSNSREVARWLSWASIQKRKISVDEGGGKILGQYELVIEFARQVYDAPNHSEQN